MTFNEELGGILMEDLRFYRQTTDSLCVELKPKLCEIYDGGYCRFCCLYFLRKSDSTNTLSYCPYRYFSSTCSSQDRVKMLMDLFKTKFLKINHGSICDFFTSELQLANAIVHELSAFNYIFVDILKMFSQMPSPSNPKWPITYCHLAAIRDLSLMITFFRDERRAVRCRIKIIDLDDKTRKTKILEHLKQNVAINRLIQKPDFGLSKCNP